MKRLGLAVLAPLLLAAGNPATETEHIVAEGESLSAIAVRSEVSASVIAAANGLQEPYAVQTGQRLVIPRQHIYVVKPGDTGMGIANRYGVSLHNIAIANGLDPPYPIRSGQKLIIPAVIETPLTSHPPRTEPYFHRPHDGKILLGYGLRADGGGHDGLDFAVKTGDMVRASASGTVIYAGPHKERFGLLVVIDHGNGWRTAYGHLARLTVAKGEVVKSGERIGIAGQSGSATRPELHFEIRKGGKRIDPAPKLAQR